jgi:hypothetical protein
MIRIVTTMAVCFCASVASAAAPGDSPALSTAPVVSDRRNQATSESA